MDLPKKAHPLLAGVCSRLGQLLRCNIWVLRTGFALLILIKTFWGLAVYAGLALAFRLIDHYREPGRSTDKEFVLESPRLTTHGTRIRELDRRLSEWERSRKP